MSLSTIRAGEEFDFHLYPSFAEAGTLGDPEAVIWSSINQLRSGAVAEWVGAERFGIKQKSDRKSIANNLKVYIQQAWEFYAAAKTAKANTGPLIYYYSFLNIAKALCELKNPGFHNYPECYRHGITWRQNRKYTIDLNREEVSLTSQRGVWNVLWESLTGVPINPGKNINLSIKELFRFCPEISVEVERTLTGNNERFVDIKSAYGVYDHTKKEAWLRFAIPRSDLRFFRMPLRILLDQISTPRSGYLEVRSDSPELRVFESSMPMKIRNIDQVRSSLQKDVIGLNAFTHIGHDGKIAYCFPVQSRIPFRMPQLMVLYTILFWLGSLVRYDPHSVDRLFESGYWVLVDGYVSQSRLWLLELFEWALYQKETSLYLTR